MQSRTRRTSTRLGAGLPLARLYINPTLLLPAAYPLPCHPTPKSCGWSLLWISDVIRIDLAVNSTQNPSELPSVQMATPLLRVVVCGAGSISREFSLNHFGAVTGTVVRIPSHNERTLVFRQISRHPELVQHARSSAHSQPTFI
jgi:hypothetical protein